MQAKIPKLGQKWKGQGGVNAGLMRAEKGKRDYFLIIPTHKDAYIEDIAWGIYGTEISGANSKLDGLKNTHEIIKSTLKSPAAEWTKSLVIEGLSDLYLPSIQELALARATCPELFENRWHWSSTQYSADTAWCQYFVNGYQLILNKYNTLAARAVRRVYPLNNSTI